MFKILTIYLTAIFMVPYVTRIYGKQDSNTRKIYFKDSMIWG